MDVNTLRIVATLVSFATFLGIAAWAVWRGNRERFEEAARLPFGAGQE
jgi:cytochrome c oxidase cbb3-type subunit 4